MLELAVTTALLGLEDRSNIQYLKESNLWMQERLDPWLKYSPDVHWLHPVKFSNLTNLAPLCNIHLTQLLSRSYLPINNK